MSRADGKNYDRWKISVRDFPFRGAGQDQFLFLIGYAILAPSSHNAQPWSFRVNEREREIVIAPDRRRFLAVSDPSERYLHIALGCAVENLTVAADYFGLTAHVSVAWEHDTRITIKFSGEARVAGGEDHLIHAITKRHSNRGEYEKRALDTDFIKWLENLSASGSPDIQFRVVVNAGARTELADLLLSFRDKAFQNRKFREEMANYKRTNFTRKGTGMPGFTMGFPDILSLIAPTLIRLTDVTRFTKKRDRELLAERTPAIIFVCARAADKSQWIEAGRLLERALLEATRRGLQTSVNAVPPATDALQSILKTNYIPQILFRAGYSDKTMPHSPRLRVEEVTI